MDVWWNRWDYHIKSYSPTNADFALKVNGDSMEPFFENGQIIFVKTVEDPSQVFSNQFVIADLNGEAYLKKSYLSR